MAKSKKPGKPKRDETREERISMEIVVDAYNEEERAMGWYCYLEDKLGFPFLTRCIKERPISPLRVGDEVEVVGMAPRTSVRGRCSWRYAGSRSGPWRFHCPSWRSSREMKRQGRRSRTGITGSRWGMSFRDALMILDFEIQPRGWPVGGAVGWVLDRPAYRL